MNITKWWWTALGAVVVLTVLRAVDFVSNWGAGLGVIALVVGYYLIDRFAGTNAQFKKWAGAFYLGWILIFLVLPFVLGIVSSYLMTNHPTLSKALERRKTATELTAAEHARPPAVIAKTSAHESCNKRDDVQGIEIARRRLELDKLRKKYPFPDPAGETDPAKKKEQQDLIDEEAKIESLHARNVREREECEDLVIRGTKASRPWFSALRQYAPNFNPSSLSGLFFVGLIALLLLWILSKFGGKDGKAKKAWEMAKGIGATVFILFLVGSLLWLAWGSQIADALGGGSNRRVTISSNPSSVTQQRTYHAPQRETTQETLLFPIKEDGRYRSAFSKLIPEGRTVKINPTGIKNRDQALRHAVVVVKYHDGSEKRVQWPARENDKPARSFIRDDLLPKKGSIAVVFEDNARWSRMGNPGFIIQYH